MFLLPILIYCILYIPFLGIAPYHDGFTEFWMSYNFYSGHYLSNWLSFHPPFKLILASLFFLLFGLNSYTVIGLILGIIGLYVFYLIANNLFNKMVALFSTLFLATSGIFISNSVFNLTDFIITILIVLSFYFYLKSAFWKYSIAISLAVLTKETALIFPVCVAIVDVIQQKRLRKSLLLPLLAFIGWLLFLHATGHQSWNDWNFSNTAEKGSLYTIINNLITFHFLNQYAYENWKHLFLFNFNWVFWLLALFGVFILFKKKKIQQHKAAYAIIALFSIGYSLAVLTFQTFPITRYILPLLPFVYLFAGVGFVALLSIVKTSFWKCWLIMICSILIVIALFTSQDPVSNILWKKTNLLGEQLYASDLGGPDATTYNMQFLAAAKKRNTLIRKGDCEKNSDLEYRRSLFIILDIPLCSR